MATTGPAAVPHPPTENLRRYLTLVAVVAVLLGTAQPAGAAETLVVAGDQHACEGKGDDRTASLIERHPDATVIAIGDMVQYGRAEEYTDCYGPTWGRFLDRTQAVAGNHDFSRDRRGAAFRSYFKDQLGPAHRPNYYSFKAGAWRIYVLDSHCMHNHVTDCDAQRDWVRSNLKRNPARCVAAFWHHPTFSSHARSMKPASHALTRLLYRANADLVVNAHKHSYERFRRVGPDGPRNDGLRHFVVGTGGTRSWPRYIQDAPGSQVHLGRTLGVMRLTLKWDRYEWQFIGVDGTILDAGTDRCSRRTGADRDG